MKDIIDYKHTFYIEGHEIELTINYIDGRWTSYPTKGKTGTGWAQGSDANSLEEYIQETEADHIYSYYFFGYNNKTKTMRKEIEKYIEELRTEAQKDRLIYVETNDEFYVEKLFNITNVYTRLQSILDYCEEEDQTVNRNYLIEHIARRHLRKSDWQRVNEAEADKIQDSTNDYEILRSRIKKTGGKYFIESIRRLSDGEVFSIGDFISDQYGEKKGIIRAFRTDYAPDVIATDMELETDSAFISLIDAKKI